VLFTLSEELLPFCSSDGGPELDGIQNLLLSARQGRHALTAKKAVLLSLSKNQALSARERATALGLANRSAELPILERVVNNKILVSATPIRKICKKANGFAWEIDVKELRSKFLNSLVVLAENSIDAELYQHAAIHHQISKKIKGVVSRSSARGGGGSQIDVELQGLLIEGTPVFAITDGDFLFPGMEPSVASTRCAELVNEQNGVAWHYGLPTRDVENIIPIDVLVDVADRANSQNALNSTKQLTAVAEQLKSCPCDFSCFKKGATLSKIFKSENAGERAYWLMVATAIKHHHPKMFRDCIEQGSCDKKDCACFVSHGFGENVLRQVKNWIVEKTPHNALHSFGASKVWMNVGEMVFDASIAFRPASI
jgi:hypothetical protein